MSHRKSLNTSLVCAQHFGLRQPAAAFKSQPAGSPERTMRAFRRGQTRSVAAGCKHESGSRLPQSKVESRFKSIAILDEEALLTILAYVDLNPLAAGMAKTPEDSLHTLVLRDCLRIRSMPEVCRVCLSAIDAFAAFALVW